MTDFESVTPDLWLADEDKWKEKLLRLSNWFQIPLINCNASHNLSDNTLVRFRGMIQDMHNPEFYFEQFEVFNSKTNEIKNKSGKYRDTAHILENEQINYTQNLKSSQRQTMVVVSLTGYNDWAQKIEERENHLKHLEEHPNTSKRLNHDSMNLKRSYDEADDDPDAMDMVDESVANKELKRVQSAQNNVSVVSREHLLNFPLPDVQSKSCIVKIYDETDNLKLNEMIEVVGFLSVDPALSGEFQPETDPLLNPQIESEIETITHNPPPSLVPRIHAVYVKKLEHCNPLVKNFIQDDVLRTADSAREHLQKVFTELLFGDKLAAEYLICHLISSIYMRDETLSLGQFSLNISNLPTQTHAQYTTQLYSIIQLLVTNSHYLPLTIDNLNTLSFVPRKDYECNRLTSGVLQLCKGTHLVLDESKLQEGRLGQAGLANMAALAGLLNVQKVSYDFKYYHMEFECDVPVLVLSEGKSLLPCEYHVPLEGEQRSPQMWAATLEAATHYLGEDLLRAVRTYLTCLKLVNYTVDSDLQFVQEEFVEMRRTADAARPVGASELHRLLVLARLVGLARGAASLSPAAWTHARHMETQRLRRTNTPPAQ